MLLYLADRFPERELGPAVGRSEAAPSCTAGSSGSPTRCIRAGGRSCARRPASPEEAGAGRDPRAGPRRDGSRTAPISSASSRTGRGASASVLGGRPLPLHADRLAVLHRGRLPARRRARARALRARRRAAGGRARARARRPRRASASATTRSCAPAGRSSAERAGAIVAAWRSQHATAHPLEPLAPAELERAAELVRASGRGRALRLDRPPRAGQGRATSPGSRAARGPRAARSRSSSIASAACSEVVCDLDAGAVASQHALPGARSPITPEDYEAAAEAVRADAGWRAALRRRGVEDVSLVQIDVLASGGFGLAVERGRRVARAVAYLRDARGRQRLRASDREPDRLRRRRRVPRARARGARTSSRSRRPTAPTPRARWPRATTCGRSRSRSPRASASPSRATRSAGTAGRCARRSTRRRASCCTTCASTAGPCCTARRAPR